MDLSQKYLSDSSEHSRQVTDDLLVWLREYFRTRVNSRWIDERRCIPPNIVLDFGRKGLFGFHIEKKYGGLALRCVDWVRLISQLGALDPTVSQLVAINALALRPVMSYGSDELKSAYMEDLARGASLCAFAQTEERAGTNFTQLGTTCIWDGTNGKWRVNGDKMWIGNAGWSGMMVVIARSVGEGNSDLGLNSFLVSTDTPGIELGVELNTLGLRGVVQNKIRFNDALFDQSALLGKAGNGMEIAVDAMSFTRLTIAAQQIGLMKKAILVMHHFVSDRDISTGKLIDNPVAINALSECIARTIVVENFLKAIAGVLDSGGSVCPELTSICKVLSTEFAGYIVDRSLQLLGGRGYEENNIIPQMFRDSRVTRIFEGPSEALLCFVGSRFKIDGGRKVLSGLFSNGDIAMVVDEVIEKVKEARSYSYEYEMTNVQKEQWIEYKSGIIGCWAVLKLSFKAAGGDNEDIAAWLDSGYGDMPKFVSGDCVLSAACIQESIKLFVNGIGDVEQTLPGLNWVKDDMVK